MSELIIAKASNEAQRIVKAANIELADRISSSITSEATEAAFTITKAGAEERAPLKRKR